MSGEKNMGLQCPRSGENAWKW